MPIEHINKTDTLNEGREKLNEAIDGANAADVTSKAADTKATQALANSESTQTQLDTIVIDGDSSVEAAQARVDEKGVPHPTLKARIDDGMNSVNQQLAQTVRKGDIVVNVEDFGAVGDSVTDDGQAIQSAIDFVSNKGGGTILFQPLKYLTTKTIWVNASNITLMGCGGVSTQIIYGGDPYDSNIGDNGLSVLNLGRLPSGDNKNYKNISIKNIRLEGSGIALWGLRCRFIITSLVLSEVLVRGTIGFLDLEYCYNITINDLYMAFNYPTLVSGVKFEDWESVHEKGLVYFNNANGMKASNIRFDGIGLGIDAPLNVETRSLIRLEDCYSTSFNNVIVENTWRESTIRSNDGTFLNIPSLNSVFEITGSISVGLKQIYLEHIDVENIINITSNRSQNITIKDVYSNHSYVYKHIVRLGGGNNVIIDGVYLTGILIKPSYYNTLIHLDGGKCHIRQPIIWNERKGSVVDIGGKLYSNPKTPYDTGKPSTNSVVVSDGSTLPKIVSGFQVGQGTDELGVFLTVASGEIINHEGRKVGFGSYTGNRGIGWILRLNDMTIDTTYYVCIDVNGGVFVEHFSTPKTDANTGKLRIARIDVKDGAILNITNIVNVFKGVLMNEGVNKMVYSTIQPTVGIWEVGDVVKNHSLRERGTEGSKYITTEWICVESGQPGTWISNDILTGN